MSAATPVTRLVRKADGSESLLLQKARLEIAAGPDEGLGLEVDQPRVRVGCGSDCQLRLSDPAVSREHLELRATEAGYLLRDLGSTNGTFLGAARVHEVLLTEATSLRLGASTLKILPSDHTVELPLSARGSFGELLGQSATMRHLFAVLERAARSDAAVLLGGESGTGKGVAALAIHRASARAKQPFEVVDCAALPASLIEDALFGHVRGAFTGADQDRPGALEQADGGTVFLDEIGELPLELQPRLLRFVDAHEIRRVGDRHYRRVDARVIAASNRHLDGEVRVGRFRQDLLYRLSVIRAELPPLRERPEDVLLLAHHFAEPFVADPHELITADIAALLTAYSWPGNVRELRNVVARLAVVPEQALDGLRAAPDAEQLRAGRLPLADLARLPYHDAHRQLREVFEQEYLTALLRRAGGVVAEAARLADLPRQSFHRMLRRHGIKGRDHAGE